MSYDESHPGFDLWADLHAEKLSLTPCWHFDVLHGNLCLVGLITLKGTSMWPILA